jgi:hypothetical protein
MKKCASFLFMLGFLTSTHGVLAQGTAFTYQGQLQNNGSPANGHYDFAFALFNSADTNSGEVGAGLTNVDVGVTNGLFTTTLDFGAGIFTGSNYWLHVGVQTNAGAGGFTLLMPLQEITPSPYAIFSGGVPASGISGTIGLGQLPPGIVTSNDAANVSLTGSFAGNGGGLTNIAASSLAANGLATFQTLSYTQNGTYSMVVPPGATNMVVKLWGAGGQTVDGKSGGGGAYSTVALPVSPGQSYAVVVGQSGDAGGGASSGVSPGGGGLGGGSYTNGGTGGQATSLFYFTGADYITKAVAGGGGGGGAEGAGGAGGNPGGGSYGGYNGTGGANGQSYAAVATTTGVGAFTSAAGAGGGAITGLNNFGGGGGGGGFGGGGGSGAGPGGQYNSDPSSGGGSYGSTIVTGSGANAGNSADSSYVSPNGRADQDGLVVVTFSGPQSSLSDYIQAAGFIGNGSLLTSLNAAQLSGSATLSNLTLTGSLTFDNTNFDTAVGLDALIANSSGDDNTAIGASSLGANTDGAQNTAVGCGSLSSNTHGGYNIAVGFNALALNQSGSYNLAMGYFALYHNVTGLGNIAIGDGAGDVIGSGDNNIDIGNPGVSTDTGIVRIGNVGAQTATYLTGAVYGTSFNATSDRKAKENFKPVVARSVLDKIAALPITEWNYKTDTKAEHIGPMAQDFQAAFGLNGTDDKHISLIDEGGVALAAIQGLNQKLNEKDAEIAALKQSVAELKQMLQTLAQKK